MWVVFIALFALIVLVGLVFIWIGSKLYLSILKQNKKFEKEYEEEDKDNEQT